MTREEAIEILKEYRNSVMLFLEAEVPAFDLAIESLSTDTEWIPCSERLPKADEQVLCCDSQSRVFTSALTEIASNGMAFFGQHCKVIAWMPLPTPYGEEGKE